MAHEELLFSDVDGLAFAAARGKFDGESLPKTYVPQRLGPLLELLHLYLGGRFPDLGKWIALNGAWPMVTALLEGRESWTSPQDRHAGFIRAVRGGANGERRLTGFLMKAKRAGQDVSGLPAKISGQLVAAMVELENNIHEHAGIPETGVLAYKAECGSFEFVAADRGVGILKSLRECDAYASLQDEGKALEAALADGVSRHGSGGNRGYGFRSIFVGLVNLKGELRFRSGDHAITMDGTSPALATSKISQKAPIDGFFASVKCHAGQR